MLDEWDGQRARHGGSDRKNLEKWIDEYPPENGSCRDSMMAEDKDRVETRRRIRTMTPQRTIDLHGCRSDEAVCLVERFLKKAAADGVEKVLIIHGKGKHRASDGNASRGVLKQVVYRCLERHPLAGERGIPDRKLGGSGAVWVAIRQRSR